MASKMQPYWTVLIPYVHPTFQTEWHPTDETGGFSTLTRGAFASTSEAIGWAREHLNGTPYSLRYVEGF